MTVDYTEVTPLLAQAIVDMGKLHDIIHGGDTDTVVTDGGTVDSVAKAVAAISAFSAPVHDSFTGDGVETDWTLSSTPASTAALLVFVDDAPTRGFTLSGNTLTIDPAVGDTLVIETVDLSSSAAFDAGDLAAIAAIAANITTVAGISANVTTVAGDATDIGAVATDLAGSDTIGTVAAAIASIVAVEAALTNIGTVASDLAGSDSVGTVAADLDGDDDIGAVAAAIASISAVEAGLTNIGTVATDLDGDDDIGTVAAAIANLNALAAIIADISTVAGVSADVTTVASNIAAVNAAVSAAARQGFRNRFGKMPPAMLGLDLGDTSLLTLSRATVGFTDTDGGGIESKAIDTPRLTHDVETGEPLGLLLEPQQTNHMIYSDFQPGGTGVTNTADNAVAPDGTMTARTIFQTADSGGHFAGSTINTPGVVSGTRYIVVMDVKDVGTVPTQHAFYAYTQPFSGAGGDYFGWRWDFATETLTPYKTSSSTVTVGYQKLANGWYRLWAYVVATGASGTSGFILQYLDGIGGSTSFTGDVNAGVAVKGCRCIPVNSANTLPPSQIDTDGSQATRSPDLATVDLSAISAFRPNGFSVLVEAEIRDTDGVLLAIGTGGTNEIALEMDAGDLQLTGASGLDLTAASGLTPGDRIVVALRVATDDVAVSVDGATVVTDNSHTLNADADEMQLGANIDGSDGLPCVIGQVAIFGPLPDATLEAMSNA
jgi:hypothetical protein